MCCYSYTHGEPLRHLRHAEMKVRKKNVLYRRTASQRTYQEKKKTSHVCTIIPVLAIQLALCSRCLLEQINEESWKGEKEKKDNKKETKKLKKKSRRKKKRKRERERERR